MFKNNNNEERKSFREVIEENKGKIIAGTTVVAVGVIGYLVYKNNVNAKNIKLLGKIVDGHTDLQNDMVNLAKLELEADKQIYTELDIVRDIAKEGALEEAIASVKRKIQYRVGKIADLNKRPLDEDAMISKELYEKELEILKNKLTTFENEWNNMLH